MIPKEEIIYEYTETQAVNDGILIDCEIFAKAGLNKGLFSHTTTNLMFSKGYMQENEPINYPRILDLFTQAYEIVKKKSKNFKKFDTFFSGEIESPNGETFKIFITQNSTDRFTLMLPEDY